MNKLIKKTEEMLPKEAYVDYPDSPEYKQQLHENRLYNSAISDSRKAIPAILAMWEKDLRERVAIMGEPKPSANDHKEYNSGIRKGVEIIRNEVLNLLSTNPNKEV